MSKRSTRRIMAILCGVAVLSASVYGQESVASKRPRVALVLAGGGAYGLAHVGAIKVLERLGIPIDIVVGTSMGASVGGLYALGYDAGRIEGIMLGIDWGDALWERVSSSEERYLSKLDRYRYFLNIDFDGDGIKVPGSLLSGRKVLSLLDRMTISEPVPTDFDSLPRRFRAVAADVATGERVVLDRGALSDAMRASMGIPALFIPYCIDGRYLVDGGIIDNLPVSTARDMGADLIIAVDLVGGLPLDSDALYRSPVDALGRSLEIMLRSSVKQQLLDADVVISVDLSGYLSTDFQKAVEIVALGEKAANAMAPEIEALKKKLGILAPGDAVVTARTQEPIRRIIARGGNARDRSRASALFAHFIGSVPDSARLGTDIAILEKEGLYEYIRVQRTGDDSDAALTVTLKRLPSLGHSFRIGFDYASTYSGSSVSELQLSGGFIARDMTTEGSRLVVDARILDAPTLNVSFRQPLGSVFFAEGFFSAGQESELRIVDSNVTSLYQTTSMSLGIDAGANPARWAQVSAGLRYEWMRYDRALDIRAGEEMSSALMANAAFSIQRLDSPIFPSEGIALALRIERSLSSADAASDFTIAMVEGIMAPSFSIPLSFAAWFKAGSDFSSYADGTGAAPAYYKPDLADRHFFPGPLEVRERIGSHVAGLGGELKFQLNWATRAIGFPSFVLVQAAAGTVLQDIIDVDRIAALIQWNATVGIGIRLSDAFGASIRAGLCRGFDDDYRPFIALDLGSVDGPAL